MKKVANMLKNHKPLIMNWFKAKGVQAKRTSLGKNSQIDGDTNASPWASTGAGVGQFVATVSRPSALANSLNSCFGASFREPCGDLQCNSPKNFLCDVNSLSAWDGLNDLVF